MSKNSRSNRNANSNENGKPRGQSHQVAATADITAAIDGNFDDWILSPEELEAAERAAIDVDYHDSLIPSPAELYAEQCAALDADFEDGPLSPEQPDLAYRAAAGQSSQRGRSRLDVDDERAASQSDQLDFETTANGTQFGERTAAASHDELVTADHSQSTNEDRLPEELLKSEIEPEGIRDGEAAREEAVEEKAKDSNIGGGGCDHRQRSWQTPGKRATQIMLEQIPTDANDRYRLKCCCRIVVECKVEDWDELAAIRHYAEQRPFSPPLEDEQIRTALAHAHWLVEATEAARDAEMMSPRQLLALSPENVDLITGIIPAAQFGVLAAGKNDLKTKTVLDLSVSLVTKTKFLNEWPVQTAVRCAVICSEDSEVDIHADLGRICRARGIDPKILEGKLFVRTSIPRLCSQEWREKTARFIEYYDVKYLAIEAPYLAWGGVDQNNLTSMGQVLGPLKELARTTGCTIQLILHNKQSKGSTSPTLHDISGVGYEELARFWLLLNHSSEWDPITGQHHLRLVVGNKRGEHRYLLDVREGNEDVPGGRVWEVRVSTPGAIPRQEQPERGRSQNLDSDKAAVRQLLQRHTEGLSATRIQEGANIHTRRWPKVLAAMLDSGELVETPVLVSNHRQPIAGYKLRGLPIV
jgi:hypothetical protein